MWVVRGTAPPRAAPFSFPHSGIWSALRVPAAAARAARRGIWAHPFYAVRTAAEAARHIGGFELVEGRVREVAIVRGRAYLNFGADWREDFTVTLAPAERRRFEAEGFAPELYRWRLVRVRGWLKSYNGPMIEATHPEQIEVIGP